MNQTTSSDIALVTIEDEMKRSYLDYAMSVIVSRALPDVRDGFKPVHRRILYAMKEGGYSSSKAYKKCARIVGDVMGTYHPHGDSAIYDSLVRMAQPFSMSAMLIDGQGNFGSVDNDPPAAMRYTEARLFKVAEALLEDIEKDTVEWKANYDDTTLEPVVLPAKFPNILVNGGGGIAVGMATNIPTHNLTEVCNATIAYIDNPDISFDELMQIIPGPDFPTGGIILGQAGIRSAFHTGRGSIVLRGKTHIEEKKDRQSIVITEIPYQVNKAELTKRIAELAREGIIEGISGTRDESDRDGMRLVVEVKRDAMAEIIINQLYKHTALQTSFGVNMIALNSGRPEMMNLKSILSAFVQFRIEVVTRRTIYDLGEARKRAHILLGLAVAVANIDEMIALIRQAPDANAAREQILARDWPAADLTSLIERIGEPGRGVLTGNVYRLTEAQAKAILDLRLHRLTGLERDKISDELGEIAEAITRYLEILASRDEKLKIIVGELEDVKNNFGVPRRSAIEQNEFEADIEDLIAREDMVVSISHHGYAKRVPVSQYRSQARGGKGRTGMATKEEDFVSDIFIANTHTPLLFFSNFGMAYTLKVYRLPEATPQSRGKALVNLLPLKPGEKISTIMPMPEDQESWGELGVIFATSKGDVRRNKLSDFASIRSNGLIAMKLDEEGEELIGVATCRDDDNILLATNTGRSIRFPVDDIRVFAGRASTGVRGIRLSNSQKVVSLSIVSHIEASADERAAFLRQISALRRSDDEGINDIVEADAESEEGVNANFTLSQPRFEELKAAEELILSVTARGFGKRSSAYDYRVTARGGQGVWNIKPSARNGEIVASFRVTDKQDLMLATQGGQVIRISAADIRIAGRNTQGVTLFRIAPNDIVVSVAAIDVSNETVKLAEEIEEAAAS